MAKLPSVDRRADGGSYVFGSAIVETKASAICAMRAGRLSARWLDEGGAGVAYCYMALGHSLPLQQVDHLPCEVDLLWLLMSYSKQRGVPSSKERHSCPPAGEVTFSVPAYHNLSREEEDERFPVKDDVHAVVKVNTIARHILAQSSLTDAELHEIFMRGALRLYNDQACGVILWSELAARRGVPMSLICWTIQSLFINPTAVKFLSDRLKMLGLGVSPIARLFIEFHTLLGRGVSTDVLEADCARRTEMKLAQSSFAQVDLDGVRAAVRRLYEKNLGCLVRVDVRRHFARRAVWAKAGSHSAGWSRVVGSNVKPLLNESRKRHEYLCRTSIEELLEAVPRVDISPSLKLEHGKTRVIYNCDSVSYAWFDALLAPVEQQWGNKSVILSPGLFSSWDYTDFVARHQHDTLYMLDYTDFNSQHTLAAMHIVFDELKPYVGYDNQCLAWCIASLDNMFLRGQPWVGTLPSGHRATTFINSVLNYAYVYAQSRLQPLESFHAGDDVLLAAPRGSTLSDVAPQGCLMNPSKQSFGRRAEFLRKCSDGRAVYGYPCRALASLCSGNWVSEARDDGVSSLVALAKQVDVVENRCGEHGVVARMLERDVAARYGALAGAKLVLYRAGDSPDYVSRVGASVSVKCEHSRRGSRAISGSLPGVGDAVRSYGLRGILAREGVHLLLQRLRIPDPHGRVSCTCTLGYGFARKTQMCPITARHIDSTYRPQTSFVETVERALRARVIQSQMGAHDLCPDAAPGVARLGIPLDICPRLADVGQRVTYVSRITVQV